MTYLTSGLSPEPHFHRMNQRVSDVAVTLCMGFLLAEVEQIGESPMAICLQRTHAQFLGQRQTRSQPRPRIAEVSPIEVNLTEHSQRISLVRPFSVLTDEFEGARGCIQCIGLPA